MEVLECPWVAVRQNSSSEVPPFQLVVVLHSLLEVPVVGVQVLLTEGGTLVNYPLMEVDLHCMVHLPLVALVAEHWMGAQWVDASVVD